MTLIQNFLNVHLPHRGRRDPKIHRKKDISKTTIASEGIEHLKSESLNLQVGHHRVPFPLTILLLQFLVPPSIPVASKVCSLLGRTCAVHIQETFSYPLAQLRQDRIFKRTLQNAKGANKGS